MGVRKENPIKFFLMTTLLGENYADKHINVSKRTTGDREYFAKLRKLKDWALIARVLFVVIGVIGGWVFPLS